MSSRPRRAFMLLAATALAMSIGGCAPGNPELPDEPAGITGKITTMPDSTDTPFTMLVEGGEQPDGAVSDKASVTVTEDTVVVGPNGSRVEADALRTGVTVKVWFEGPVAESYPVQGGASFVQLTE